MDSLPTKNDLTALMLKILPPFILSVMTKIAADYKKGKRFSWLSSIVVVCLAASGAILGYWITQWLHWKEYKMTLTIFFFGLFSDKFFEFLFSKTFLNAMFNYLQDALVDNLSLIISKIRKKE